MKEKYLIKDSDYEMSYFKISGKKVKDVTGWVSNEFGEPIFKISHIYFEDGTIQGVEGEHDFPYIIDNDDKTQELMEKLVEEEEKEDKL